MISAERLAEEFGVTVRTANGYVSRGCPQSSLKAARDWRDANIASNGPPTISERRKSGKPKIAAEGLEEEELRAKIRKLNEEADAKALKNAQLRRELYDAAEVERNVAELTGMIRVRLESWPGELQTEWPLDVQQLVTSRLTDKIHLLLTEMSQWRLSCDDAQASESELPTAAENEDAGLEPAEHTNA